jgi:aspartyl-tRNA(Asn)/glutamyl-tRNA(Gln) amidotransferase subunit A
MTDYTWKLGDIAADLVNGRTNSRALTTQCLERIADPQGEGRRAFTFVFREEALGAADLSDRRRASGAPIGPLEGVPVSVKDLFDVTGVPTLAGSVTRANVAAADRDALIVSRLRAAGAVIVGKTSMTEFAYSGLGLNPHYGTPANPWDPARIPGGSSSGAGVAGPYGFSVGAIGTDTGGSVRIPAAFCGVTGFKPTTRRIPRDGAFPLSRTLDSIGPLAASVNCCALLDAVLAGEMPTSLEEISLNGLRILLPVGPPLLDDLDGLVARAFDQTLRRLSRAGAQLTERRVVAFDLLADVHRLGGIAAPEAFAVHRLGLGAHAGEYDPHVRRRLEAGGRVLAADYIEALDARAAAIRSFDATTRSFDVVLCPTVAVVAPKFDGLLNDDAYLAANALVLRNTSIFNLLDRPALSLPCQETGSLPVGLMVVGRTGEDRRLLAAGAAIEAVLGQGQRTAD